MYFNTKITPIQTVGSSPIMASEFQCSQRCCVCLEQSGCIPSEAAAMILLSAEARSVSVLILLTVFLLICFLFRQPMVSDRGGCGASTYAVLL